MEEYTRPLLVESDALSAESQELNLDGVSAGNLSGQYIRLTVLLAGVLFLVGIGSTFTMVTLRYGLIGLGLVIMILATVYMVNLPQPDFNLGVPTQLVGR
jgi:hypothetical protein